MPVYSKIQQIRGAKRRERQQKWKQKKIAKNDLVINAECF